MNNRLSDKQQDLHTSTAAAFFSRLSVQQGVTLGTPHAGDLYLAAMDAVNPINPDALFTIKGADQAIYSFNGGQGFVTDQTLVAETQSSNPNAFFRTLLAKSYANQVA